MNNKINPTNRRKIPRYKKNKKPSLSKHKKKIEKKN
jgi:hypothetical protein